MHHASALLELLLPTLLATTPAPLPIATLRAATPVHTVEIEIVEKPDTGKRTRTRLALPANGKLEAWVGSGARPRKCSLESHHDLARGELTIDLRCRDLDGPEELAIWARPQVVPGKRASLASIERAGGGSIEISATMR
ncbi:MAG: hypothetical protein IAG13_29005 [Deltaproteobacteria bacterium]|nr:hypothetical protein [Nannocystaceae bacterium]